VTEASQGVLDKTSMSDILARQQARRVRAMYYI